MARRSITQGGDGGQQRLMADKKMHRRAEHQGLLFFFSPSSPSSSSFSFLVGEEMKGVGLNLCLVSDVGDVIMRGQGEQVLPHYCNENDIPPLHQLEKVAIKVPNKVPPGEEEKKTTLQSPSVLDNMRHVKERP